MADQHLSRPQGLDPRDRAKAWYAIRYEAIVDAIESVMLRYAQPLDRPITVRSLVYGRLQILLQSAYLDSGSHMYIRDAGADFAVVCGGSIEAMTDLRLVLCRKLVEELPAEIGASMTPSVQRMISEMLWGYARAVTTREDASHSIVPVNAEPDYGLEPAWYGALVDQSPNGIAIFHAVSGAFVAGNQSLEDMFGYSLAEFDRLPNDQVYTSETPEDDFDKGVELMAGKIRSFSRETAWRHRDGHTVWCVMSNWLVRNDAGDPEYLVCTFAPLLANGEYDTHWQRADKRFRYLAQSSSDPMFIVGVDNVIRYASPATERTLGADPDELVGQSLTSLVLHEDQAAFIELHREVANRPRHAERREIRLNRRDGQSRWFEITATNLLDVPEIEGYSFQARDVSDRKLVEQLLAQQALFDPLTNLLNRRGMLERLERAIRLASKNGTSLSVLYIDLDNFKQVNDRYGHEAGDEALVVAAGRLADSVGTAGIVARWGGDEFVVVIEESSPNLEDRIVRRILAALNDPIEVGSRWVRIQASIGRAFTTPGEEEYAPMSLLRIADMSLYRTKASRNGSLMGISVDADASIGQ